VNTVVLAALLVAGVFFRIPLLLHSAYYSSDTAILDLMAAHFSQGQFCFYYWAESYYGVLDPFLLMPLFRWFGYSPQVSQLIPFLFSIVFLFLYHAYIRSIAKPWVAHVATLWLAIPSPYFARYTFGTYNYIFGLIFGMGSFVLAQRLFITKTKSNVAALAFGLLAGFSWYYFRFILFFWVAIALSCLFQKRIAPVPPVKEGMRDVFTLRGCSLSPRWRRFLVLVNGANVLNALFALFLWLHGNLTVNAGALEMKFFFWATAKISLEVGAVVLCIAYPQWIGLKIRQAWQNSQIRFIVIGFVIGYVPAIAASLWGYGALSPGKMASLPVVIKNSQIIFRDILPQMLWYGNTGWERWLICVVVLSGIGMLLWRFIQSGRNRHHRSNSLPFMLSLFVVNLLMCIFCNELGNESNGRYLLPFYIAIPLGIAWFMERLPRWGKVVGASLISICLVQAVKANQLFCAQSDIDNYTLLGQSLIKEGIRGGYADYWVAYKMTALMRESLIIAPNGYKNRYQPYIDYVGSLPAIVMLGGPLDPTRQTITILGHTYKILRQNKQFGFLTTYLKRL